MDPSEESDIPVFQAGPQDERKTVVVKKEQKVSHSNLVPDYLVKNEFLNSLIESSLPKNYNFEVHKTIWKIKQTNSRRVLLQFPEGLIRFGPILVDIMQAFLNETGEAEVRFITMGDLTYGACCIDDYLAASLGCDLIVHYAHSCLVPINTLNSGIKYLYIFLDIKFDMDHLIECVKHNFKPNIHNIALASTVQFVATIHSLAKRLTSEGFNITLPQSRPLTSGEVLGCTAPKLESTVNTILFVCDGRFHLEALMIANPRVDAYRYDPYSRKLTHEVYEFEQMYQQRYSAIDIAIRTMRNGGTFGFVLGTLGRQGSEKVYDRLIDQLNNRTKCKSLKVMMPEVVQNTLKEFDSVDVWVQVACPRLSIDWGSFFHAPLLNPYEFAQAMKLFDSNKRQDNVLKEYPMDFYAKNSCGNHTPNHSCLNNRNCECSS